MTLRIAHQLGLALSLTLSIVAALWGQALPTWAFVFALGPWSLFLRDPNSGALLGRRAAGALVAASVAVAVAMAVSPSQGPIVGALFLVLCMLTLRLFTRALPSHDLHALALGLLLLLAGTALSQDIVYAILFVAYAIATTWALITRQLWHELTMESFRTGDARTTQVALGSRDVVSPRFFMATASVALLIALGGAISFVLLPRFGGGGFRLGRTGQLSGDVHLGDMGFGGDDGLIAARVYDVSAAAYARGIYLRTIVYDAVTLEGFTRTGALERLRPSLMAPAAAEGPLTSHRVRSAPLISRALPVLSTIAGAAALSAPPPALQVSLTRGTAGELWTLSAGAEPITYRVSGNAILGAGDLSPRFLKSSELLPHESSLGLVLGQGAPSLSPNIRRLAQSVCGSPNLSFASRASHIRAHLKEHFTYVRRPASGDAATPLESFLFSHHRGHCEYFATAMAALLRECGVPSRVVGGYYGGTWDEDGPMVLFYGKHAHSWVEWYLPGVGWVQDDATPSAEPSTLGPWARRSERLRDAWERHVINFGLGTQLQLLRQVAGLVPSVSPAHISLRATPWRALGILSLGALVSTLCLLMWRRRRNKEAMGTRLGRALLDALNRNLSVPVSPTSSLRQAVARIAYERPEAQSSITRLTEVLCAYEAERFGTQKLSRRETARLLKMLAEETRFALDHAPKAH